MSYQVLARKWRPRSFRDLVGQEHIVSALTNALDNDRLHHAFLFTGTRGIGKTTIARILAKALNCQEGVSSNPCGVCPACREIDEGRFVDLIEVDAASRTGVDDTRELLDNVPYAPSRGRYKVYLIDEVHMFSKSSFNALLKTLEEPPPHIKFLLATTDPQRLPITVLSRCLQFNLKRLPQALIAERLENILVQEGIEREPSALQLLARAGDGSMRDALSLLDQAIAFGGGQVSHDAVSAMLGTLDQRQVLGLLEALAANDAEDVLKRVEVLEQSASDYTAVLAELISLLQRIALAQAVPSSVDESETEAAALKQLATVLAAEEVQLLYQIALIGRRDLPLSPEPRGGFEMILLRMLCFRPAASTDQAAPTPQRSVTPPPATQTQSPAASTKPSAPAATANTTDDWNAIVAGLSLIGAAQQLALNCALQGREGNIVYLQIPPNFIRPKLAEQRLEEALKKYFGEPQLRIQFRAGKGELETPAQQLNKQQQERRQAAIETINRDPNVQALQQTFNAQVNPDSIVPVDD